MSTRCNIIVKDDHHELIFYKHSDGYPKGTLPLLNEFLDLVKSEKIRDNTMQAAGWLILLGHNDMAKSGSCTSMDWKVGWIEPTTMIHEDIEYLYTIDLVTKTIETKEVHL